MSRWPRESLLRYRRIAMCGIFFSLGSTEAIYPDEDTASVLRSRGPDSFQSHTIQLKGPHQDGRDTEVVPSTLFLTFVSTVLSLRGDHIQVQPLVDPDSQSVLCWNGEAWKVSNELIQDNDAQHIFHLFLEAVRPTTVSSELAQLSETGELDQESVRRLTQVISAISGPFSFVFYDGFRSRIHYGRDYLGRRSLLSGFDSLGRFRICSVCDGTSSKHFEEIVTDGIHMVDVAKLQRGGVLKGGDEDFLIPSVQFETMPWGDNSQCGSEACHLRAPIPSMNKIVPEGDSMQVLCADSPSIKTLELRLRQSLELRIRRIPEPRGFSPNDGAKVAVLFSGGLDCTILARLSHDIVSMDESIDLLNVSFENPRVVAAATNASSKSQPTSFSIYECCPDRQTGRASYAELQRVCPGRNWRFVAINIPYSETLEHRDTIKRLMRPHNTEMDLSIACALYFASRGRGEVSNLTTPYTTSARVLLSGLGADEVFAGYSRHGAAFTRHGFKGLIDEIELDVGRLGKRNLGRDDRVISHWGREARYPYLDEDFLAWAVQCPVWEKCGFGTLLGDSDAQNEDSLAREQQSLEPEKKALRLLAWKLGMRNVAREKKRAIQFGARTAKMESGRSRGTTVLS